MWLPPFGAGTKCRTRPGARCGTAFSKNIPDLDYGLVPGPGATFWDWNQRCGWNERCGTRRVAQPFWAGTGSGTTAWYQGMVLDVVPTFGAGTRDVVIGSVPFKYGIWHHGLVPGPGIPDVVPPFGAGSALAPRSILHVGEASSRCGAALVPPFGG